MIAAADAVFLRRLTQTLHANKMDVYRPGKRRSSAAVILRFGGGSGDSGQHDSSGANIEISKLFSKWDRGMNAEEVVRRLEENVDQKDLHRPSDIRVLFVKRAIFTSDRWSGQVALPGGGRDPDDADDKETLRRETYHELGIPLDSPDFVLLGRLEDYQPRSRGLTDYDEANGAVQARFVYLHIGDLTPSVVLSRIEIEAVRWCPFRILFDPKYCESGRVVHHLLHFVPMLSTDMGSMFRDLFPNTFIRFPSIAVEPSLPNWRIWGLPLRTVSQVLEFYPTAEQMDKAGVLSSSSGLRWAKRQSIDWPRFSSNNFLVQFCFVDAYHGYLRLRSAEFVGWKQRLHEPYYLFALATDGMLAYSFLLMVMTMIYTITVAFLMALNIMEHEGWEERKKTYYAENKPLTWSSSNFYAPSQGAVGTTAADFGDGSGGGAISTKLRVAGPGDGATLEKLVLSDTRSFARELQRSSDDEDSILAQYSERQAATPTAHLLPPMAPQEDTDRLDEVILEHYGDERNEDTTGASVDDVLSKYRQRDL